MIFSQSSTASLARPAGLSWPTTPPSSLGMMANIASSRLTASRTNRSSSCCPRGPFLFDHGSITGRVVLERQTVQVEDVQADAEFRLFIGVENDHRRSMLGVPLVLDDAVVGVIVVDQNIVQRFSEKQIELIET
ncbi:GAF domain-containing protein, partial [Bosea thiooxidans]